MLSALDSIGGRDVEMECNKHDRGASPIRLKKGEKLIVQSRRVVGRRGRNIVRARVVGEDSLGWFAAAILWGVTVEAFVGGGTRLKRLVGNLYPDVFTCSPAESFSLPPQHSSWNGMLLTTARTVEQFKGLVPFIESWKPLVVLIATPHKLRAGTYKRELWLARGRIVDYGYLWACRDKCKHGEFGGVTTAEWDVWKFTRVEELAIPLSVMTKSSYPRVLQTALDDTRGADQSEVAFEASQLGYEGNRSIIGHVVSSSHGGGRFPVYDGQGYGPDLSTDSSFGSVIVWVRSTSVYSPRKPVRRQAHISEVAAIWDYADKDWTKQLNKETQEELLFWRLRSPPAKVLRGILFTFANRIQSYLLPSSIKQVSYAPTISERRPVGRLELEAIQRVEATQADDAPIDTSYWALPDETPEEAEARDLLRRFSHHWWVKNLEREAYEWLEAQATSDPEDAEAIEDCLRRARGSNFWEWPRGSRLFFWRYSDPDWRRDARDGVQFWHVAEPPRGMTRSPPCASREDTILLRRKIFELLFRWYLEDGHFDLLIGVFGVPKGKDDIRAVWNAKSNGLNDTLWAPRFGLPMLPDVEDIVVKWLSVPLLTYVLSGSPPQDYTQDESLYIKSYGFDNDCGQMFNNFQMHKKERKSHGVRFIHTRNGQDIEPETFVRWCVLNFGCMCSPYLAYQGECRISEMARGDPADPGNPFQYSRVLVNLPMTRTYDASLPRLMLLRSDGELASQVKLYIDDYRGAGRGKDHRPALAAQRRLAQKMNYYGNQDAARKRRFPSLAPGAWNGGLIHCTGPYPVKATTSKKWQRGVDSLEWLSNMFETSSSVPTSELRRIAGVWVDITSIYPEGRPYLKGMFNAMEAFRSNRDVDGWRLQELIDEVEDLEATDASTAEAGAGYPLNTSITNELKMHVSALQRLFNGDAPRLAPIRPEEASMVRIAVGDASAEGFGYGTQFPEEEVVLRDGLWDEVFSFKSSNLREATNIGNNLLRDIESGVHDGCEVWVAVDNAVWSAVWNKGMSSARDLFNLVVDVRVAAYHHGVFIKCFHISGERMKATGIDGASRGDMDAGIALGYDVRPYLPLDLSAFDYPDNSLESWCKSWMGVDYRPPLSTMEWFAPGKRPGVQLWAPCAALALTAMKQLSLVRLVRPYDTTHVVLIPRLLYQEEWRRRFEKEMDIWFILSCHDVWPCSACEPLIVGLSFPLYRSYPWLLRIQREKVVDIGRTLSKMSKSGHLCVGDYLRKLWKDPRALPPV